MVLTVVTFVLVLSILVFVHEAGHFFAAKRMGMKVEEFGFGFPPRLFGIERGGTVYSLNWIPLGGFVKIAGEGEGTRAPGDFSSKSIPRRLLVLCAGVLMNLVLAAVLLSVGYAIGIPQEVGSALPYGAVAHGRKVEVADVLPGGPAAGAGVLAGDAIVSVEGQPVATGDAFRAALADRSGQATAIGLSRGGKDVTLEMTPVTLSETGKPGIGIGLFESATVSYPWYLAPYAGVRMTGVYCYEIGKAFGGLLSSLARTGKPNVEVSGPVGIAVMTGEVAKLGFVYLLQFVALLSLNLAFINILPLPALDGGRVLFLAIERVRGKAVRASVEGMVHQIGFLLLMLLVAFVTFGDVMRYLKP